MSEHEPGFPVAWELTLSKEGGFSDNPKDRGGPTMFGITERVARAHGYERDMRDMPLETAKSIAKVQYWDVLSLDAIWELSQRIALELFDTGYNMGVGTVGRFFQRSLNVLNREQLDYGDIQVDGIVGRVTVAALRAYLGRRSETILLRALNCLQGADYIRQAEAREASEEFLSGWLSARVRI